MNRLPWQSLVPMRAALPLALLVLLAGCSDDDDKPTDPGNPPDNTASTAWDEAGGYWRTTVNASDYAEYRGYSFAERDTVEVVPGGDKHGSWEIAFRREAVKLNGGASGDGHFVGALLEATDFDAVSRADTADASWETDHIDYQIDTWYEYDPEQHRANMTRRVFSMVDASGAHFVKFRVDSIAGSTGPIDMGTVHLSYYFQANADDRSLDGEIATAAVTVGDGVGYFDFSTGAQVDPSDRHTSLDWDLAFFSYEIAQNCGPNGPGACAAFQAHSELTDPTDLDAFAEQPAGAPLFPDSPGSVLTNWYDYNPQTHQLSSKNRVYLLRSEERIYKFKILGYYGSEGGVPVSGVYTFVWNQL